MGNTTLRLTMAQAIVRYLVNQYTEIDGARVPLFAGSFGIFGHGNVTCLAEALEQVQDRLPTWRGQNEQSMALAAIAYAKAKKRRQIMIATSSVGPGATNMVTAAAVAHANRLPVLLLCGDTFTNRLPDPVLQQVEHFGTPSTTVNDSFRAVSRFWDRITHPAQIIASLPQAVATLLDPADCGPAFLGLPQDIQEIAYDYPEEFFAEKTWQIARPRASLDQIAEAVALLKTAKNPLILPVAECVIQVPRQCWQILRSRAVFQWQRPSLARAGLCMTIRHMLARWVSREQMRQKSWLKPRML